ncbi:MAG: dTDP-4-dehydrorhamnose 3,5-epimerase family protein [Hyphomicrobiales bacterium]
MLDRFEVNPSPLEGLFGLTRKPLGDSRGYLERVFCDEDLADLLENRSIVQVNRTFTARAGTVRGLHFQNVPSAEAKIVSCFQGAVFDVAVDLRADSPTFLHWYGEELNSENRRMLFIPEGFAHGFQTLTKDVEMFYMHTAAYDALSEGGLNALDPRLGIDWPDEITERSHRDQPHSNIEDDFEGLKL